ncbi:hypothetical protein MCERH10_02435 [Caulobacteraceae bacterium]
MSKRALILAFTAILVTALAACASTEMKTFVGKPIEEAMFAYGRPENVMELADNSKAYQFRWGGGTMVLPSQSTSTAQVYGNSATVRTTATPAMIMESQGCLITFITVNNGTKNVITEYRIPKQLVC